MFKVYLILFFSLFANYFIFNYLKGSNFILFYHKKYNTIQQLHDTKNTHMRIGWLLTIINILLYCFFFNWFFINNFIIILIPFIIIGYFYDLKMSNDLILRFLLLFICSFYTLSILFLNLPDLELLFNFKSGFYINFLFYLLCFMVLMNGFNFIDGSNGMIIFYSFSILFSLLSVSILFLNFYFFNNIILFILCLLPILVFNYPKGKVFFGDSGAYLLALLLGILAILFVTSSSTNYWFLASIFFLPAFEVLFSFLRKILTKKNPLKPDGNHLHQLIGYYLISKIRSKTLIQVNSLIVIFYIPIFFLVFINCLFFFNTQITLLIIFIQFFYYISMYYSLRKQSYVI